MNYGLPSKYKKRAPVMGALVDTLESGSDDAGLFVTNADAGIAPDLEASLDSV